MGTPKADVAAPEGLWATARRHGLLLAVLAPVALMVVVRWGLQWRMDRLGVALPPLLSLASDPDSVLLTAALVAAGCVVFAGLAWWLVRKPGPLPRPLRTGALVLWVVVWLAGSAQAVRSHFNGLGVQASRTEVLRLVGLKAVAPSLRSLGGARLYLDWPEHGGLHTVQIESPSQALLQQPAHIQLQLAPGRWGGWYTVGWSLADAPVQAGAAAVSVDTPTAPRKKATP